jgi:hypothetical protein
MVTSPTLLRREAELAIRIQKTFPLTAASLIARLKSCNPG